jgi:hypothetical protein
MLLSNLIITHLSSILDLNLKSDIDIDFYEVISYKIIKLFNDSVDEND